MISINFLKCLTEGASKRQRAVLDADCQHRRRLFPNIIPGFRILEDGRPAVGIDRKRARRRRSVVIGQKAQIELNAGKAFGPEG